MNSSSLNRGTRIETEWLSTGVAVTVSIAKDEASDDTHSRKRHENQRRQQPGTADAGRAGFQFRMNTANGPTRWATPGDIAATNTECISASSRSAAHRVPLKTRVRPGDGEMASTSWRRLSKGQGANRQGERASGSCALSLKRKSGRGVKLPWLRDGFTGGVFAFLWFTGYVALAAGPGRCASRGAFRTGAQNWCR